MVIRLARLGFVHNEKSLDVGLIIGLFKGDCCLCVGGPLDEKLDCSVAALLELTLDLCFEGNRPPSLAAGPVRIGVRLRLHGMLVRVSRPRPPGVS